MGVEPAPLVHEADDRCQYDETGRVHNIEERDFDDLPELDE
jgi:hypothetical protein